MSVCIVVNSVTFVYMHIHVEVINDDFVNVCMGAVTLYSVITDHLGHALQ